jgi:type IV secretory pathway protease TraF
MQRGITVLDRSMRRRIARATTVLLGATLVACADSSPTGPSAPSTPSSSAVRMIRLSDDIVTLTVGQQVAIDLPESTAAEAAQWSADDANIASVGPNGSIRAVGVGSTTVTVTVDGRSSDVLVSVLPGRDALGEAEQ